MFEEFVTCICESNTIDTWIELDPRLQASRQQILDLIQEEGLNETTAKNGRRLGLVLEDAVNDYSAELQTAAIRCTLRWLQGFLAGAAKAPQRETQNQEVQP